MKARAKARPKTRPSVSDYDDEETSGFVDRKNPLRLEDLGLKLPAQPPTQVVSIRLPSALLNEIRAFGSQRDIPYQALIKLFLSEKLAEVKKKGAV